MTDAEAYTCTYMTAQPGVREQRAAAPMLSTAQSDGAPAHSAAARRQLVVALCVLFVAAMAAGMLWGGSGEDHAAYLGRLVAMALLLPIGMAVLARRVLEPMEIPQEEGDGPRDLHQDARTDALSDLLTGLGNDRAFPEELSRQIEEAQRYDYPVSLALIDLDDLQRINDELGHAAGDRVLAAMGRLVATTMRAGDRGFRIGDDEFAILLPRSDAGAAHATIRRLLVMALGDEVVGRGRPAFSFSGGVTSFPELARDGMSLRRQADAALSWAKRHGRTDVQVYDRERHGSADDHRATPEPATAYPADLDPPEALSHPAEEFVDPRLVLIGLMEAPPEPMVASDSTEASGPGAEPSPAPQPEPELVAPAPAAVARKASPKARGRGSKRSARARRAAA